jgi:hypothetical protein
VLRVHDVVPGHVHPEPDIETSVMPDGTVSVTVTVPLVDPALAPFETVTVYVALCCPSLKLPVCVLAILRDGGKLLIEFCVTVNVWPEI